jgi:DNA-binding SARP family transcriptional activator/cytochrome c-type biogenesis protein CcmH/NrfG
MTSMSPLAATARAAPPEPTSAPIPGPTLAIGCLGGLTLGFAGGSLPLAGRKARALLAFLALEGGTAAVPRDRLSGLFWPDVAERQARNSLRQTLFELREVLERRGCEALVAARDEVSLAPGAFALDLDRVLAAIRAGEVPEVLRSQPGCIDQMLAGCEDLSPLFADWLAARRRTALAQVQHALDAAYGDESHPRAARRQIAEAALRLDPTHEAACRVAMRLAAEDGELGIALRHYAALYDHLGTELDMEPSAATQALAVEIKQGLVEGKAETAWRAPAGARAAAWSDDVPRVAVLPFRAIGADPVPRWFAEGMVEEVICSLAAMREPVVIAGRRPDGAEDGFDAPAAGAALGARYVVSGTVRRGGESLRLTVKLTAVEGGAVVWARNFDATDAGLFAAQDAIAASVANTLAPRVQEIELGEAARRPPGSIGAYHLVLQARHAMATLEEKPFEQAGDMLRRAIALDGRSAIAHATHAAWLSLWVGQRWSRDVAADTAAMEGAVARAIAADPQNARALSLLGHNRTTRHRRYDEALRLLARALELAPNDATTWLHSSPTYAYLGDGAEAVRRAERALALAPEDPFQFRALHFLAIAHYVAGDFAAAADCGRRSMALNPRYLSNLRVTAAALAAQGEVEAARILARDALTQQPGYRVHASLPQHPFSDAARRETYGRQLLLAGFPP